MIISSKNRAINPLRADSYWLNELVRKGIMTVNGVLKKAMCLGCLIGMAAISTVHANPHGGGPTTITGVVYKQGLVFDEVNGSNQPRFVEFDAETGEVKVWLDNPLIDASDRSLWISNGADYRRAAASYNNFLNLMSVEDFAKLQVVTKDEFDDPSFDADYPAELQQFKGRRYSESRSLLVYKPEALDETIQLNEQNGLIVFESRYDLEELRDGGSITANSLLLSDEGKVLHSSADNIGYRVAYVTPNGETAGERSASYQPGDELVAPITYGTVSTGLNPVANFAIGEDGRYQAYNIMPPCPGMTVDFLVPVTAAIPYRTYNPQRKGSFNQYFFSSYSNYFCAGAPFYPPGFTLGGVSAYIDSLAAYSLLDDQPPQAHFQIDVTLLSGQFKLSNGRFASGYDESSSCDEDYQDVYGDENCFEEIPIGDSTVYSFETDHSSLYKLPESPDFNFDGVEDYIARLNAGDDDKSSSPYGVWFNLGDDEPESGLPLDEDDVLIEPDLVRYTTQDQNFDHLGLLTQISETDLANTDVFVFRESTGELVVEKTPFSDGRGTGTNGVSTEINGGYFELTIPGRDGVQSAQFFGRAKGLYEDWQADMDLEEAFQGDVDSLRAGEPIRVVAINRSTGYVGSVRTNLTSSEDLSFNDSTLGIQIPNLILYPPNMKVEVTRQYEVEYGLTQGEERQYGVGFEGAALHGDQYLSVHTEWLDYDGTQLPSKLPGLTGRLSSLVSENTLDSTVNHFDIKPGKHIEVLNLSNGTAGVGASHQYFHVIGENKDDNIDFGPTGIGELQYRPGKPVPVQVAVYNEERSRPTILTQSNSTEDDRPESSAYQWVYRPEMTYSVYELEIDAIYRQPDDENLEPTDILNLPTLNVSDSELLVDLDLVTSDFDSLQYFGPDSDVLFSIEGTQELVEVGKQQEIVFSRFPLPADADGLDYLSLILLNNQDKGNVLWEWTFGTRPLAFPESGEISVDTGEQDILLVLPGFNRSDNTGDESVSLQWSTIGSAGNFDEFITTSTTPFHSNKLLMERISDRQVTAAVRILRSNHPNFEAGEVYQFGPFRTIAGEAADIKLNKDKESIPADFTTELTLTAEVKDQFGNLVENGTAISWDRRSFGEVSNIENQTTSGLAKLVMTPDDRVGQFDIKASSGEVDETISVSTNSFSVGLETAVDDVGLEGGPVVVTATVPNVADGAPIKWVARLGIVEGDTEVIDGRAVAVFEPGPFAGVAKIYASVGQQWSRTDVTLSPPMGFPVFNIADALLIGDRTEDGVIVPERLDGVSREVAYRTRSNISLTGLTPGEKYEIRLGTAENPNIEPVAWFFMDDIVDSGTAPEIYHDYSGKTSDIVVDRVTLNRGTGSYLFASASELRIKDKEEIDENGDVIPTDFSVSDLHLSDNFGLNISLRPNENSGLLIPLQGDDEAVHIELVSKSDHYGVRLIDSANGYFPEFWVNTAAGEQSLRGTSEIGLNFWSTISVKVKNNAMWLTTSDTEIRAELSGPIVNSYNDLVVGGGFEGHIDNLKIFNYNKAPMAMLGDGGDRIELIANENGEIQTTARSLGNLRTASPLEAIVESRAYWRRAQNDIVELDTNKGFITFMTYGIASELTNLAAQVIWDEGEGGEAIVYEFAASTFVVGDVRDILKYGIEWRFGYADAAEKLTFSLATVGILTTVTPIADLAVAALKILVKKAVDTPAAQLIVMLIATIVDEAKIGVFLTLEKYSDLLQALAKSDMTDELFQRALLRNVIDLDVLNNFRNSYGDGYEAIIGRLYTKFGTEFADDIADQKVRELLKGLTEVNAKLGVDLSEDAIDGIVGLLRIDGVDSARIANLTKWADSVELENALKAVKGIDELTVKPDNYIGLFKTLATKGKDPDPITGRGGSQNNFRGALNVITDVGSTRFGGVGNIVAFEFEAPVILSGLTEQINRRIDVVRRNPDRRIEYKAWESSGGASSYGGPHGSTGSVAAWELVRDILYRGDPTTFEWVIRGADVNDVRDKMLQTLGDLPYGRAGSRGPELHPVLEEAIQNGDIDAAQVIGIINQIKAGNIIRAAY